MQLTSIKPTADFSQWGKLPDQAPVSPNDAFEFLKKREAPSGIVKELPTNSSSHIPDHMETKSLLGSGGNALAIRSIPEQARALRYDIDLFYEYVHDNITFIPTMGLSKGGLGALVENSGNAFDQCDLLVKLCQQADAQPGNTTPYNARFVIGSIELSQTQWSELLGLETTEIQAAVQLFANGGIGAVQNISTNTIQINHCWVIATIAGQTYAFDPALKSHTKHQKIDIASAIGYVRTSQSPAPPGFMDRALSGATLTSISAKDVNSTNIDQDLTSCATNLVSWLKQNNPGAKFEDVLGGLTIRPTSGVVRNSAQLPYQVSVESDSNTNIPDSYRTLINISYDNAVNASIYKINVTFAADFIYGKRLTLFFSAGGVATLRLDGVAYGNPSGAKSTTDVSPAIFTVQHPYASNFADTSQQTPIRARGQHLIGTAFGLSSKHISEIHQEFQNEYIAAGYAATSEELLGTSLNLIWDNFIGQASSGVDMLARLTNSHTVIHHMVGTVALLTKPSTTLKIKSISSFLAGFSVTSKTSNTSTTATAVATSILIQALEGPATEQVTGKPSGDAIRVTSQCNRAGIEVYCSGASYWPLVRSALGSAGFSPDSVAEMETYIYGINPGWRVIVPADPTVNIGAFNDFYGFSAINPNNTSVITQTWFNAKGAASADAQDEAGTASSASSNARQVDGFGMPATSAAETAQVNMLTGRFEYAAEDLTVGNQEAPYSLNFTRFYNSESRLNFAGLGFGWNHNWQFNASVNSNGFIPFGDQQVAASAGVISSLYILTDVVASNPSMPVENFVILCEVARWMADLLSNNIVRLQIGASTASFTLMPDGTYLPAMNLHGKSKLSKDPATGAFTYTTSDQIIHNFDNSGKISNITYPFGTPSKFTISFVYTTGRLTQVSNGFRQLNFTYDSFGQLIAVNDGNGRTVRFTIDSTSGNLTVVKNPLGDPTTYSYDQRGRLVQVFKPAFPDTAIITNVYDSINRVKEQHDAFGNIWQFFLAGTRSAEIAPDSTQRLTYFDAFGNIAKTQNALDQVTVNEYDGNQRLVKMTLPEGNSTTMTYDADGNRTSITLHPKPGSLLDERTTWFEFDTVWNQVSRIYDSVLTSTEFEYGALNTNGAGKLETLSENGFPKTRWSYNAIGQKGVIQNPSNQLITNTYDPVTHDLLMSSMGGRTTLYSYDVIGNVLTTTNERGNVSYFGYDSNRQVVTVTIPDPSNSTTTTTYDANGNIVSVVMRSDQDSQELIVNHKYAADGNILSSSEGSNLGDGAQPTSVTYEYDSLRRPYKRFGNGPGVTEILFDPLGRSIAMRVNGLPRQTLTYTANGQLDHFTDERGNITSFTYDGYDRQTHVNHPDSSVESFVYDRHDHVVQSTLKDGTVYSFGVDSPGLISSKSTPGKRPLTYKYDASGRIVSVSNPAYPYPADPTAETHKFTYDGLGRIVSETLPDGKIVQVTMDNSDNFTSLVFPNGQSINMAYNQAQHLTSVSGLGGSVQFTYDSAQHVTAIATGNSVGEGYSLDTQGNLVAMTIGGLKNGAPFGIGNRIDFTYKLNSEYMLVGKRSSPSELSWEPELAEATSFGTANTVNQYEVINGTSLTYDANGNMLSDGNNTYEYDDLGYLTKVSNSSGTVTFKYDLLGRLVEKIKGTTKRRYVYAGIRRIEEYDGSDTLLRRYVYGAGLDECRYSIDCQTNELTYLHSDENGTPFLFSDANGNVVLTNKFDSWGRLTDGSLETIPIGFQGQFYDEDTQLYYFKARFYSPKLGRFLQEDPLGFVNGSNLYQFANNNPVNFSDPTGLDLYQGTVSYTEPAPRVPATQVLAQILNGMYANFSTLSGGFGGLSGGSGTTAAMNLNTLAMYYFFMNMAQRFSAAVVPVTASAASAPIRIAPAYLAETGTLGVASAGGIAQTIPQVGIVVAGITLIAVACSDLPKATDRIRKNWELIYSNRAANAKQSNHGNSLRNPNRHYVYVIVAAPGTPVFPRGIVGQSGIVKFGIGQEDAGRFRLVRQISVNGATYLGFTIFPNLPNRIVARALETALIVNHSIENYDNSVNAWNRNRPPLNLTF